MCYSIRRLGSLFLICVVLIPFASSARVAGLPLSMPPVASGGANDGLSVLAFSPAITGVMPTIAGAANDLVMDGAYGYVADTVGLRIVDLTAPDKPAVVGTLISTTKATGVAVLGQYAYFTAAFNNTALKVVDVSDKANPRLVSSLFPSSGGASLTVKTVGGRPLAVVGGYFAGKGTGVQVVDVSNPLAPLTLGFATLGSTPQAIVIAERYAYVAAGPSGVQVIDLINPSAPTLAASFPWVGNASRLAHLRTNAGYILAVPTGAGVRVLDVNNPLSPLLVTTVLAGTTTYDVAAAGGAQLAVAAGGASSGLLMVDVSTPAAPKISRSLRTEGMGSRLYLGAEVALLSTVNNNPALNVISIQPPSQLTKVGAILMITATSSIAVSGSTALVGANIYNSAMGNRSLLLWANNLSPKRPAMTGSSAALGIVGAVAFSESGDRALVGGNGGSELQVIEVATHYIIGRVAMPFGARVNGIKIKGNLAYIAGGDGGLVIVDLGLDGRLPAVIGAADTTGGALSVDVAGKYAYVADNFKGLQVVDVSNPSSPRLSGAPISTLGAAQSVRVQGQYLYLAHATLGGNNGLSIFDLSNPAVPVNVGALATAGNAVRLDVAGGLVYLAGGNAGLIILDVNNPRQPFVVKTLKTFGFCRDVKASGGLVFLADDSAVEVVVTISPAP